MAGVDESGFVGGDDGLDRSRQPSFIKMLPT
jgi:hypothetical protein